MICSSVAVRPARTAAEHNLQPAVAERFTDAYSHSHKIGAPRQAMIDFKLYDRRLRLRF